ncbi:TPA: hypothetical protein N0F65_008133 [Lagenidium giganteum]|uniref:Uncharacterized protein n=1 Tax=Lagenidium giganteum TaxID=4803 RepID=A0AAV2YKK8_9STRA|nr:TPA: hypothetical protein N0F65_008133 [Lagenidium giganteum]
MKSVIATAAENTRERIGTSTSKPCDIANGRHHNEHPHPFL